MYNLAFPISRLSPLDNNKKSLNTLNDSDQNLLLSEKEKIAGAIRTDFILSAEIIVITLGTVADANLFNQILVLSLIAILMTIGVYGLVALIVKLDDVGWYLNNLNSTNFLSKLLKKLGGLLLVAAPKLMKLLAMSGTIAMFLVGGSILAHGIHGITEITLHFIYYVNLIPVIGNSVAAIAPVLLDGLIGVIAGGCALLISYGASAIYKTLF